MQVYIILISVILVSVLLVLAGAIISLNRYFYSGFLKVTQTFRNEAGIQDGGTVTEGDLKDLPLPVAAYVRASGLVGRQRISFMHITHSGTFRAGADKQFVPIKGEYFLTTHKPSFCWFGRVSIFPGFSISAMDSYFNGSGRMLVKILSFFRIVDDSSDATAMSAFGRCIAEMTLSPSFFLDKKRIVWTAFDTSKAACTVTDAGLTTDAQLYFRMDGNLDSIEIGRYFDRKNGQFSHEKFTGKGQEIKDYGGLKLPSVIDGYWNLREGDLHYVHFMIDKVEFE